MNQIDNRYVPNLTKSYVWQDDAACVGIDPEEFQYLQTTDPGYESKIYITKWGKKKPLGERDTNRAKLEKSALVCAGCPVRQKCLDEANSSDLFWTLRGGRLPGVLEIKTRFAPAFDVKNYIEWGCKIHGRKYMSYRDNKGKRRPYCTDCAG